MARAFKWAVIMLIGIGSILLTGFTMLIYAGILNIIALGQYFVVLFRGRPLYLHDILAVKTAAAVVSN